MFRPMLAWLRGRDVHEATPSRASVMFGMTQIHYLLFRLAEILDEGMQGDYKMRGMLGVSEGEPYRWLVSMRKYTQLIPFSEELWKGIRTTEVCNYQVAAGVPTSIHARREIELRNRWIEILQAALERDGSITRNEIYKVMQAPPQLPELDEDFYDHGLPKWYQKHKMGPEPFHSAGRPQAQQMPRASGSSAGGGHVPPGSTSGAHSAGGGHVPRVRIRTASTG